MKTNYFKSPKLYLAMGAIILGTACSKQEEDEIKPVTNETELAGNTQGVMMQGFYWNTPAGGNWWNTLNGKIASWKAAGITSVWLPPVSKGMLGSTTMGYDPYDYYDMGTFNQMGTTETRHGSKSELQTLLNTINSNGITPIADIVLNHNSGGASQANPNTGGSTYTSFITLSGQFNRGYNDFHPSTYEASDEGVFGGMPDLCHANPYVQQCLYSNSNSFAKTLKGMGFKGWRFDYVLGFHSWVVKNWVSAVGGFGVAECWNGNLSTVQNWLNGEGNTVSMFDFPGYYGMEAAFNNNNLANLVSYPSMWKSNPNRAVTFIANHDLNTIGKKLLAYAFMLTHEGYPCIFYSDYESGLDKNKLNNLIWINKNLAAGTTTVLYSDNDEYIARMSGSPGLVVYINISGSTLTRSVTTNWTSKVIKDFAGNWAATATTNASKVVTISVPANSYTVWSTQ